MTLNNSALIALLLIFHFAHAQVKVPERFEFPNSFEQEEYAEYPEDEYAPVSRENMETSPAYRIFGPSFTAVQVNVSEAGENILGDAANEPSIAVSPANPSLMAIGWRQFDDVNSNFRQAGFAYSEDAGLTWVFPGVIEPGVFRSDPVLDTDSEGAFYYNSLTVNNNDFSCDVYRSTGPGSWDAGTYAFGGDKQWMAIDRTGGATDGNIYAYWNESFSICPEGMFTRSTDRGMSYDDCVTLPQRPVWGTLAVGPEGEVYACGISGNGGLIVVKSANAGNPNEPVTWDFATEVSLDGMPVVSSGPNPGGLLGQVWVAVDRSGGITHGNVYLLCSVARFSTPDVLDVMFARSTDGGLTWSDPVKVNDDNDPTAYQWFGTMAVAPNGRIDVVWLDTRDDPGGFNSSLYHSFSEDGGLNWSANEAFSEPFDPHLGWPNQPKMGDYFDMQSDENGAHLAWTATFNGEQ
ncbi:MAG: exo-alpha-sialidase, partial [Phaeodactylibacter sp.]|nr:exo-alpha-sialidase [Phaeodactylibacter sp.]